MRRIFNFSAGPSTLPMEVLEEAQAEFVDFHGDGMSLIEMSHRGRRYTTVHEEAAELARSVLDVPAGFSVLFLQGGATLQFSMVPLNLLASSTSGAYVVSGAWATKALADARVHGDAYAAWDGAESGFGRMPLPDEIDLKPNTRYLHVTSNETIGGIQMSRWPEVDVPLVGDMSSDFASRPIPWDRFDIAYGGAQKNLGPAGVTLVIARDSALEAANDDLGAYLRYEVHRNGNSMYNTPPVFAIWIVGKVLRWVADRGGVRAMESAAHKRSALLYDAITAGDGFYRSPVDPASRSTMNVVFRLPTEELEAEFITEAAEAGMVGLKGHRSVGGCRASLYNAMPAAGVARLAEFMAEFRAARG